MSPIDDWTSDEDEAELGDPEDPAANYEVDWILEANYRSRGSQGRGWYYLVKWAGWKNSANTEEPKASFMGSEQMPAKFWKALRSGFEPDRNAGDPLNRYTTPPHLLEKWVDEARKSRRERNAARRTQVSKSKGKKRAAVSSSEEEESSSAESSSSESSSSEEDSPPPPPPPPKKQKQVRKESPKPVKRVQGRPSFVPSPRKQTRVILDASDSEEEDVPLILARKVASPVASGSRQAPNPQPLADSPTAPVATPSSSKRGEQLFRPATPPSPKREPTSPSPPPPPPVSPIKRIVVRPLVKPPPPAPPPPPPPTLPVKRAEPIPPAAASKPSTIKKEKVAVASSAEKVQRVAPAAAPRKTTEQEKLDSSLRRLLVSVASAGPSSSATSANHPRPPPSKANGRQAAQQPSKPLPARPSNPLTSNPLGVASSSRPLPPLLLPSKPPTTSINLFLGRASSSPQPLGTVDILDITPQRSPSSQPSLETIFARSKPSASTLMDVVLEQTFTVYRAAVIFATRPRVVQWCRVVAEGEGSVEERGKREESFEKMAWWLEHSSDGGSISIAYIPHSPFAFVVLPRSSPLCTELGAPPQLRDRYSKESLVGALLFLSRPTLPRPDPKVEFRVDVSLDRWGIRGLFVNELRGLQSVAIFAPRSQNGTSLPGIATLEGLLTQDPSPKLPSRGTEVLSLHPGMLELVSTPVVLMHNSMAIWTLPSVVELRKENTRFFSFGLAKEIFVPSEHSQFREFGVGRKLLVALSPSTLLDQVELINLKLLPLLRRLPNEARVVLHPSTILYLNSICTAINSSKQATLDLLRTSCRFGSNTSGLFSVSGPEPPNPSLEPLLVARNLQLDKSLASAITFPQVVLACQTYCSEEGARDIRTFDEGQATVDALRTLRAASSHPSRMEEYRRFVVVGEVKTSPSGESFTRGLEQASLSALVEELSRR